MSAQNFEEYDYQIPTWALGPIVNADSTDCTDEELAQLDEFEKGLPGLGTWHFEDTEYFSHYNDITDLGGNIVDAIYAVFE